MRNVLSTAGKGRQVMLASIIRNLRQSDKEHVAIQFDEVVRMLERTHAEPARMLNDARNDLLASRTFTPRHWSRTSTAQRDVTDRALRHRSWSE